MTHEQIKVYAAQTRATQENTMITATRITPITYPCRPMKANGTVDDLMKLPGKWAFEPKYNGHRALVHVPTRTMFNRHGGRLSIAKEFDEALDQLSVLARMQAGPWLDCEALSRRADKGKGTLVVLDVVDGLLDYEVRRFLLEAVFPVAPLNPAEFPNNSVVIPPVSRDARSLWDSLQKSNDGAESAHWFYEGIVAKQIDSRYPIHLRSPDEEFLFWLKLRWRW